MISSLLLAVALAQSHEPSEVPLLVISCKLPNMVRPEIRSLEQEIEPHITFGIQDSGSVRVVSDLSHHFNQVFKSARKGSFQTGFVAAEIFAAAKAPAAPKAEIPWHKTPSDLLETLNVVFFDQNGHQRMSLPDDANVSAELDPRLTVTAKDGRYLTINLTANSTTPFQPKPFRTAAPPASPLPEAIAAPLRPLARRLWTSSTTIGQFVKELFDLNMPVEVDPELAALPVYIHGKGSPRMPEYVSAMMATYRLEWKPNGSTWVLSQTDPSDADKLAMQKRCRHANLSPLARTGHLTPELFEILNQSATHKWRELSPETQRSIEVLFAKNVKTPENFSNLVALFSPTSQEELKLHTTFFVGVSASTPTMTIGTASFLN
jgi:hypothetical protein